MIIAGECMCRGSALRKTAFARAQDPVTCGVFPLHFCSYACCFLMGPFLNFAGSSYPVSDEARLSLLVKCELAKRVCFPSVARVIKITVFKDRQETKFYLRLSV